MARGSIPPGASNNKGHNMRYILPLILATPTFASPPQSDILEIQQGDPWVEVYYSNSASQNSNSIFNRDMELNGVRVKVWVEPNAGPNGAERIRVEPQDSQLIAIPPVADVMDGEDITIIIMPPMF